ncbi:MAG: 16S rRNA (guanine(966)-N(2))-methyltransferase RsmD [Pseudomonadota bacterium]
MRIISGTCRGKKLTPLAGRDIRPTSDRVRESIFNIIRDHVQGAAVLDLFAGTGALGLEALSRGADHAVFVDASQEACSVVKANCHMCRLSHKATIICQDLTRALPPGIGVKGFDLVFMDPPYGRNLITTLLNLPGFMDVINPGALMIAEHSTLENPFKDISGLDIPDQRKYGKTRITFFKYNFSQ